MSKLFKLKRWLTVEEASAYLTGILGEPVRQHEIYRLAIDGNLRLSVVFLSDYNCREAHKKTGEIRYEAVPSLDGKSLVNIPIGGPIYETSEGDVFQMSQMVSYLAMDTPYLLPMIGGEVESVERRYWEVQGIERAPTTDIGGTFVSDAGQIYRIEDRLNRNDISRGFFPIGSLPAEIEFVVTPSDLMAFQSALIGAQPPTDDKPLTAKEETTLLNIIGALLALSGTKEAAIISELLEMHPSTQGIKKRTLEEKFAAAKRSLGAS